MQATPFQEDPTCYGAAEPVHHNYWASALERRSHGYWAQTLQLLKPTHLAPILGNKENHHSKKPVHFNEE